MLFPANLLDKPSNIAGNYGLIIWAGYAAERRYGATFILAENVKK